MTMQFDVKPADIKYRPDIDGLRAVAVLAVVAYHVGLSKTPGGFIGVDVFFVISGYLISYIMFSDIAASRFSVMRFYERRIRRIFPALFAMFIVFSIFAYVYFLPSELVNYSNSLLGAIAFASNFYFWKHSGYFDSQLSQPLLHTWSLAVEEQFYIFFPLFLVMARKFFPQRLRAAVVVLFLVSLLTSAIVVSVDQETAFFMLHTRTWELLMGTLLALGMFPRLELAWLRNLAALAGLGMIAFAIVFYSESTVFPGLSALAPCVGAALIIGAGESGSSLVGRILSTRPIVFIGLISYSLYLWHWPVIILQHMGVLTGVNLIAPHGQAALLSEHQFDVLFEIVVSLALAAISWRFVERPFRTGQLRLNRRPLFALAAVFMVFLSGISSWGVFAGGFKERFPAAALQVASIPSFNDETVRTGCFITSEYHIENYNYDGCLHSDAGKKNILLLGDSHSAMLWSALSSSLHDYNIMQASCYGCKPFLHPSGSPDCLKMMTYMFQTYLPTHPAQRVFLVGRWERRNLDELTATIAWMKQHQVAVTVFGPVPEYDGPLPRLLAYSIAWHQPNLASQHLVVGQGSLDEEMQALATNTWHVPYISLYKEICGVEGCAEYADAEHKIPLMEDANHLSQFGAHVVVQRLIQQGEL